MTPTTDTHEPVTAEELAEVARLDAFEQAHRHDMMSGPENMRAAWDMRCLAPRLARDLAAAREEIDRRAMLEKDFAARGVQIAELRAEVASLTAALTDAAVAQGESMRAEAACQRADAAEPAQGASAEPWTTERHEAAKSWAGAAWDVLTAAQIVTLLLDMQDALTEIERLRAVDAQGASLRGADRDTWPRVVYVEPDGYDCDETETGHAFSPDQRIATKRDKSGAKERAREFRSCGASAKVIRLRPRAVDASRPAATCPCGSCVNCACAARPALDRDGLCLHCGGTPLAIARLSAGEHGARAPHVGSDVEDEKERAVIQALIDSAGDLFPARPAETGTLDAGRPAETGTLDAGRPALTDDDALADAATRLLDSLGEYVRQSMHANPEWADGVRAVEAALANRRRRPALSEERAREVSCLADVLAAWKAWPGRGEGLESAAVDAMVAVHEALYRGKLISPGDITEKGEAIQAASRGDDGAPGAERTPETVLRAMLRAYEAAALNAEVAYLRTCPDVDAATRALVASDSIYDQYSRLRAETAALLAWGTERPNPPPGAHPRGALRLDYEARLSGTRPLNAPPLDGADQ